MSSFKRGDPEYPFNPRSQLVLFSIGCLLLYLWYNRVFVNPDHNLISLYFSVVTFVLFLSTLARYLIYFYVLNLDLRGNGKKPPPIMEVPDEIRCPFGEVTCHHAHFSTWGIIHLVVYILLGLIVPGYYLEILIASVICEAVESALGFNSKFIMDPLTNVTGYWIGSMIYSYMYPRVLGVTYGFRC